MKVKELFVCEICKTEYNTFDKAYECEKFHAKLKSVKPLEYLSKFNDACPAPRMIYVTTEDGEEYIYKRVKE